MRLSVCTTSHKNMVVACAPFIIHIIRCFFSRCESFVSSEKMENITNISSEFKSDLRRVETVIFF